jgi:sorbitol-specific phosphotransferase system component IIC
MLEMVMNSAGLFFRGKLFAQPGKAYTQLLLGILFTVLCLLAAVRIAGLELWVGAALAGFLGGSIQPYLFRNLRFR